MLNQRAVLRICIKREKSHWFHGRMKGNYLSMECLMWGNTIAFCFSLVLSRQVPWVGSIANSVFLKCLMWCWHTQMLNNILKHEGKAQSFHEVRLKNSYTCPWFREIIEAKNSIHLFIPRKILTVLFSTYWIYIL